MTHKWTHRFCSRACFVAAEAIPPAARFWPKVNKDGPVHPTLGTRCWLWTGATFKGYGLFSIPGRPTAKAHRVAWELLHGPITDGSNVLHHCDVAGCVNAESHLFLGTLIDNNKDMWQKGRARGPAKLTAEIVRDIRTAHASGATQRELSRRFLVAQTTIFNITHRNTWKHVE